MKMPLRMQVGLVPGNFVFDGESSSPQKGDTTPLIFSPSIVAKRLDVSGYRLVWRYALAQRHCVRWGPSSP